MTKRPRKQPKRRSAAGAALAKPVNRHRVIPDKRMKLRERDERKHTIGSQRA